MRPITIRRPRTPTLARFVLGLGMLAAATGLYAADRTVVGELWSQDG